MTPTPELQNTALPDEIPNKILFRPEEAAEIFGVHVRTIYRWYETGLLDGIKPNDRILRIFRKSIVSVLQKTARPAEGG
jgi:predicted site-specific integrase-resolvase